MIEVKGTAHEIADLVSDLAPDYPAHILRNLDPGECHFIRSGIDIKLTIKEADNGIQQST